MRLASRVHPLLCAHELILDPKRTCPQCATPRRTATMRASDPAMAATPKSTLTAPKNRDSLEGEATRVVIGDDVFQVNDAVVVKAPGESDNDGYVGKIVSLRVRDGQAMARVCWFYRPEETRGGARAFHGSKELFASDHYDWVHVDAIDGKCRVYSLKEYQTLESVNDDDYYARFLYKSKEGSFRPEEVPVFCACAQPYNPDRLMVECERCEDWFHPECVGETQESVTAEPTWMCRTCRGES